MSEPLYSIVKMSRVALALLILGSVVAPAGLRAQERPDCPYRECALRIEERGGLFSRRAIVRGTEGEELGRIGFLGAPDLDPLLADPDSAAYYYREFRANHPSGNLLKAAGGLLVGAAIAFVPDVDDDGARIALLGGGLGGFVLYFLGDERADRATNSLARAIWWYNRGLER